MDQNNMIICRCEEVTYQTLVEASNKYNCTARELKQRTRACMGYCGGRTCRSLVNKVITTSSNEENKKHISLKYQHPVRPIHFADLGRDEQ